MSQNKYSSLEYSYEYDNSIYKHKADKLFILGNQALVSLSFVYALEHLGVSENQKIKKVSNIKGLPVITHQDDSGNVSLLLVVPFYDGEIITGMQKIASSTRNKLEDVVNETIRYKTSKNLSAEIMFLNYSHAKQKGDDKILTPFGFMYLSKPTFVSLEKE